nr:PilN domain-containing protein [uncultured Desulfuromonas sp.]
MMKLTINFASRRYVNERAVFWAGAVVSFLLLVFVFYQVATCLQLSRTVQNKSLEVEAFAQEVAAGDKVQISKEDIVAQKEALAVARILLRKDAFRWTALFDRLERLLPPKVSIRSLSPDFQTNSLKLTGAASELKDLQTFLDLLHHEPFSQVFLKKQEFSDAEGVDGNRQRVLFFSIDVEGVF